MKRIICHWTAGTNSVSSLDKQHYHFIVDGMGLVHRGIFKPEDNEKPVVGKYAAHTLNLNTGSIGIAVAGMAGAVESPFQAGVFPINDKQVRAMCKKVADLCRFYNIPVTPTTVLTHAEVQPTLGITQRGKWDIARLPYKQDLVGPKAVGDYLRMLVSNSGVYAPPQSPVSPIPAKVVIDNDQPTFWDWLAKMFGGRHG